MPPSEARIVRRPSAFGPAPGMEHRSREARRARDEKPVPWSGPPVSGEPLRLETRPDGALILTRTGGGRWGTAVAGFVAGGVVLGSVVTGETTILAAVIAVPLGIIAVLTGLAAARHRDWIVFDRRGRVILSRQGLTALFRAVSSMPFAEVEAIVVEEPAEDADPAVVGLRRRGGDLWLLDTTADPGYRERLVAALRDVGGWAVEREREPIRP